jgi:hypothetical protein
MTSAGTSRILYSNLDTSFVNLWALLRYLSQRSFMGRVHVELENYSADVFLNGSETPLVHEVDRGAGTEVVEEAALHRLVLRVRESPGSISVFEGPDEAVAPLAAPAAIPPPAITPPTVEWQEETSESVGSDLEKDDDAGTIWANDPAHQRPAVAAEWNETMRISGELIGAVDRAASSLGADFVALFRDARISLADDYSFLDPMTGQLRYEDSQLQTNGETPPPGYVTGVTEALTRVVGKLAAGEKERRTRERFALELARVARKNGDALARSGFAEQLDRIAGTKVI